MPKVREQDISLAFTKNTVIILEIMPTPKETDQLSLIEQESSAEALARFTRNFSLATFQCFGGVRPAFSAFKIATMFINSINEESTEKIREARYLNGKWAQFEFYTAPAERNRWFEQACIMLGKTGIVASIAYGGVATSRAVLGEIYDTALEQIGKIYEGKQEGGDVKAVLTAEFDRLGIKPADNQQKDVSLVQITAKVDEMTRQFGLVGFTRFRDLLYSAQEKTLTDTPIFSS